MEGSSCAEEKRTAMSHLHLPLSGFIREELFTFSFSLLPQLLFLDMVSSEWREIREENGKWRTLNASKLPLLLYS